MNATWSYACVGGGHINFMCTKKHSSDGEDLNMLTAYTIYKALKTNKKSKAKAKKYSDSDGGWENFNFEKIEIRAEFDLD